MPRLRALVLALLAAAAIGAQGGEITFYERPEFGGRGLNATAAVPNLATIGFNDLASSMIIRGGLWQVCADAYFRGDCITLPPGRYPSLAAMRLDNRISSARETAATWDEGHHWNSGQRWGGNPGWGNGPAWGYGSRAILYDAPQLSGRWLILDDEVAANLATSHFNDRAGSLRIENGYWLFCTDAYFQGECRTFGPGDYPTLDWGLNRRISSGRRIDQGYPYRQSPAWGR